MLNQEIKLQTEQGKTVTASYEVFDGELIVYLPDGSTRSTTLRGVTPESAALHHLKSFVRIKGIKSD